MRKVKLSGPEILNKCLHMTCLAFPDVILQCKGDYRVKKNRIDAARVCMQTTVTIKVAAK